MSGDAGAAVTDAPGIAAGSDNCDDAVSPSRSRSSSISSSDPSRATSPASTVDDIGCIPEEPEDESPEPDDRLVDKAHQQDSPPIGGCNDVEEKTDRPESVPPQDEDVSGQPDLSAGVSNSYSSSSSTTRTDMGLLKAILHDDAIGNDDVIPEETNSQVAQSDADNDDKEQPDEAVVEESNHKHGHDEEEANVESAVAADQPDNSEANQEVNNQPPDDQADECVTTDKPPTPAKRKKKQTVKKNKKKQQQQQLGPVAPWSRASINSLSRPSKQQQQQQPLASDRSTSLGAGSIGGASRGSRAHSAISSKEMREKYRPVSNEEKMAQRLSEIDSLLARDYAYEARLAYQRSVAECRQAWQNYASTARIMGHVTDQTTEPSNQRSSRAQLGNNEDRAASIRRNHPLGDRVAPELDPAVVSFESVNNSDSHSGPQYPKPHRRKLDDNQRRPHENGELQQGDNLENEQPVQEQDHPVGHADQQEDEQKQQQQFHGYRVGAPQRMSGRFGSDHKLSESNNPEVRAWLRDKNRAERRQRRETRDVKRREMQALLDAQQLENERRREAEAAFQYWSKKKRQQDQTKVDKSIDNNPNGKRPANGHEPLPLADQEAAFAELENRPRQGGHRPPGSAKPVHNSVFKRTPAILGTAGASFSGRQVRMGVIGQHVEVEPPQQPQQQQLAIEQPPQVRLSFDEWSQRKSEQLAAEQRRQREAEQQRREAAAAADPQMSALVPQLARRRIRTATELKQRRTDTGLGLSRPRTAVPALAPSQSTASAGRRHSARARTSSLERREAGITSQLANPFVAPAEDAMLDRILGGGNS